MLAYGSKRTHSKCATYRNGTRNKVHIKQTIKNKKFGRQISLPALEV
jgi:hypothetical protein